MPSAIKIQGLSIKVATLGTYVRARGNIRTCQVFALYSIVLLVIKRFKADSQPESLLDSPVGEAAGIDKILTLNSMLMDEKSCALSVE